MLYALLLVASVVSTWAQENTELRLVFQAYTRFLGLDTSPNGYKIAEISSIAPSGDDPTLYYAIGDVLIEDKPLHRFRLNTTTLEMEVLDAVRLDDSEDLDTSSLDSEGIAYIPALDDSVEYLMIGSEGHRTYNTTSHMYWYEIDGSYVEEFNDIPAVYDEDNDLTYGIGNNAAFEGIDIDANYMYYVYTTERPLVQDLDTCSTCIRISVNSIDRDTPSTVPELTALYTLRYDTDNVFTGLPDITIINDNLDALILERESTAFFRCKVYLVNLQLISEDYNVINCDALGDEGCVDKLSIEKQLVLDFEDIDNTGTSALDDTMQFWNWEGLSRGTDGDGDQVFIAVSDNNEDTFPTYFMVFRMENVTVTTTGTCCDPYPSSTVDSDDDSANIHFSHVLHCALVLFALFVFA